MRLFAQKVASVSRYVTKSYVHFSEKTGQFEYLSGVQPPLTDPIRGPARFLAAELRRSAVLRESAPPASKSSFLAPPRPLE